MKIPETILVPTDFSDPSTAALEYAVVLAEKLGARVHVVHAFELPVIGFPDSAVTLTSSVASGILDAAQKALDELVTGYASRGVTLAASLEQADPREGILQAASRVGADLIVMGTHGRRGIARALIGSVAEHVVRRATLPVLTVHAGDA